MPKRFLVRIKPEINDPYILTIGADLKKVYTALMVEPNGNYLIKYRDLIKAGISINTDINYLLEWEGEPMYPFTLKEIEIFAES